jgi:hypothetical protein
MILENQYKRGIFPFLPKFLLELDVVFNFVDDVKFVDTYRAEPRDQENAVPSSESHGM